MASERWPIIIDIFRRVKLTDDNRELGQAKLDLPVSFVLAVRPGFTIISDI
jgi:hypothetical protein